MAERRSTLWSTAPGEQRQIMHSDHPLVQQARSLASQFGRRSAEIEANRKLPPDIAAQMGAAGFYRLVILERNGALEAPPMVAAQFFQAPARADPPFAWTAFI